jgi:competence protein ComEC
MLFSFGFFAGTLLLLMSTAPPSAWTVGSVLCVAVAALAIAFRWRPSLAFAGACLGFALAAVHAADYLEQRWPASLDDERAIAQVLVDSIPAPTDRGWAFDAEVRIERPAALARTLHARIVVRDPALRPSAGERWTLLLSLRSPRGRVNPGPRDFERQQFREGVHALGTVVPSAINRRIDDGHRPLTALREKISRHIDAQVVDRDASALISALAVGDTGRVSREQWRVFNATGTTHLVAISGLHVTLFAVAAFFLSRRLWSAVLRLDAGRRFLTCRRETFAALTGFTAAAAYAWLAGLSVPTQRTLIMLGAWLLARSVARATRPFQPFAWALLLVLLVDPVAPLSAGFWLSFVAMGAIILVTTGHFLRRPMWREAVGVQVAVTVVLLPVSLAIFGSASVIGPWVNALAIPAMSWVLVPIILLSILLMPISLAASDAVLAIAARLHELGWPLLAAAGELPWALVHASPPWWWYALSAGAISMALLPWPLTMRAAALLCLVPLASAVDTSLKPGMAELTVLDVGEGTSAVVRTTGHVLVVGTGDSFSSDGRTAENVLVPFLRGRGVHSIDRFLRAGSGPDASPGLTALLAEIPVARTSVDDFDCEAGPDRWHWGGVDFSLLRAASLDGKASGIACALLVSAGGRRMLVPIQLDASGEAALVAAYDLRADIVIVPRGGSDSASTHAFVSAVQPTWAVVSGRRMRGSAARPAVSRWEQAGAQVAATSDLGAIRFVLDAEGGVEGPVGLRAGQGLDRLAGWPAGQRTLWRQPP